MKVIRNGTNYVAGFILILMSLGLFFIADPWMLWIYEDLGPEDRMNTLESLLATGGLCLIATIGVILTRLRIEIREDALVRVVNPVWTWEFSRSHIVDVNHFIFPRVTLDSGHRIYLFGAEETLAMRLRGAELTNKNKLVYSGLPEGGQSSTPVTRTVRYAVLYVVPWLAGVLLSIVGLDVSAGR